MMRASDTIATQSLSSPLLRILINECRNHFSLRYTFSLSHAALSGMGIWSELATTS